jgi:hypothetical protein
MHNHYIECHHKLKYCSTSALGGKEEKRKKKKKKQLKLHIIIALIGVTFHDLIYEKTQKKSMYLVSVSNMLWSLWSFVSENEAQGLNLKT